MTRYDMFPQISKGGIWRRLSSSKRLGSWVGAAREGRDFRAGVVSHSPQQVDGVRKTTARAGKRSGECYAGYIIGCCAGWVGGMWEGEKRRRASLKGKSWSLFRNQPPAHRARECGPSALTQ